MYFSLTSSFIHSLDGRTLALKDKSYRYFSGTSYLGINFHPEFQQYLLEGIAIYGSNYGGSRLSNLQFPVYESTEHYLAQLTNNEAALTFSSGTLAGQLLSQHLSLTHELYYAPKTHPALWNSTNIPTIQEDWIGQLIEKAKNTSKPLAIFANSIDPLYCTSTDFSWWQKLPKNRKTTIILDDSHGLGILGKKGAGIISTLSIPEHIDLIISSSLGKAYAIPGGAILGSQKHIDALKSSPLFGGASPIIPAYLYAFLISKTLYQRQLKKLRQRTTQFISQLDESSSFQFLERFPVFYTSNQQLCEQLHAKDILISSFPYPTQDSPCINRIVLNAAHDQSDVKYLLQCLKDISKQ